MQSGSEDGKHLTTLGTKLDWSDGAALLRRADAGRAAAVERIPISRKKLIAAAADPSLTVAGLKSD